MSDAERVALPEPRRRSSAATAALLAGLLLATASAGQEVISPVEDLDFDAPESWALKTFAAISFLTSLGPVEPLDRGDVRLGLELLQVPHFDLEQRTVGYGGRKEEDLNRSPVQVRIRATVGLGAGFSAELGLVPPVEVDGTEATLVSAALERSLVERGRGSLGVRLAGQLGEVEGDFTCAEGGDHRFPPGSAENPFGCRGPSRDHADLTWFGVEVVGAVRLDRPRWRSLHASLGWQRTNLHFRVDAEVFGFVDRTLLRTEGDVVFLALGSRWSLGRKTDVALEAFWAPLDVQRLGDDRAGSDDLLHARALVERRLGRR